MECLGFKVEVREFRFLGFGFGIWGLGFGVGSLRFGVEGRCVFVWSLHVQKDSRSDGFLYFEKLLYM